MSTNWAQFNKFKLLQKNMQVLNHGWQRIQIVGFQLKEINLLLKIPDVLIFNISNCSIRCGRSGMFSE